MAIGESRSQEEEEEVSKGAPGGKESRMGQVGGQGDMHIYRTLLYPTLILCKQLDMLRTKYLNKNYQVFWLVLWVELHSPNRHIEVLTAPIPQNGTLLGNKVIVDGIS